MCFLGNALKRWVAPLFCVVALAAHAEPPSAEARLAQALNRVESDPRGGQAGLEEFLAGPTPPEMRLDALVAKGRAQLSLGELDQASGTADRAMQLAGQVKDEARRLDAEQLLYCVWTFHGEYKRALLPTTRAFERAQRLGLKLQMARLANLLGAIHNFMGEIAPAVDFYLKGLRLSEESGAQGMRLQILQNLGNLYLLNRNEDKALECIQQALPIARQAGNAERLADLLITLATCLERKGMIQEEIAALEEARTLAHRAGLKRVETIAMGNMADLYLGLKRYEQALLLSEQALAVCRETMDLNLGLTLRVTRAQALSHMGRASEAIVIMRGALKAFQARGNALEAMQVQEILANTLEAAGRYREALAVLRSFKEASDAILQKESQSAVAHFQEQFEAEKRNREITSLKAENDLARGRKRAERAFTALGGFSLVVIAGLLYWRHRAMKRSNLQLHKLNARLEELSLTDTLTGLRNRRYLLSRIEEETSHARRQVNTGHSSRLGMMMVDLDHFKLLNDTEGHAAGDALLQMVAERLQELLRRTDILVRWGGEEFMVLSRDVTPDGLSELAQRLVEIIRSEPFTLDGKAFPITCSLGYCCFPLNDWMNWQQTLQIVDAALYQAKDQGRDRAIGVCAGATGLASYDLQEVLDDLPGAVEKGLIQMI